jgi:hypothetical protein
VKFGVRIVLVLTLLFLSAFAPPSADATCEKWRCTIGNDTAQCYVTLLLPGRRASSCREVASCIWEYQQGTGWQVNCTHSCEMNYCYEV